MSRHALHPLALALALALAPAAPAQPPPTSSEPAAEVPAAAAPASAAAAQPAPRLVIEQPIHDAGQVRRGARLEVVFTLANTGDAELLIRDAQPACGCTVARFDERIAPGATGTLHATLSTGGLEGPVAKSITLLTNDPASPKALVTIKADVLAFVTVVPSYARILQVQTLAPAVSVLQIWSEDDPALEIRGVEASAPWIEVAARRATTEELRAGAPAAQWRLEVSLRPDAPLGPLSHRLLVRTSHPRQPELEIPLSGFVRPILSPAPAAADFGRIGASAPKNRFVLKLFNFGKESVELRSAVTDLAFVTVAVTPEEAGRRFRIELLLAPDAPKGKFEGTLRVETSSSAMPVVEVPVRGRVG